MGFRGKKDARTSRASSGLRPCAVVTMLGYPALLSEQLRPTVRNCGQAAFLGSRTPFAIHLC